MKPLRLAIVRQRYTPFGGAERFIDNALQALGGQDGLEVSLIAREWRGASDALSDGDTRPTVVLCRSFHIGRVWRQWAFSRAACKAIVEGRYDLVQSHERLACCDVFRAGDGIHREWLRQRDRILPAWRRWLTWLSPFHHLLLAQERRMFASPRLRTVIAISRLVRDDILRHYPDTRARIEVIYNGVDLKRFHPSLRDLHRQAMRARYGIGDSSPLLLFVGSGFERKGLATVIHALSGLPDEIRLIVAGKDGRRRYERLAEQLGVGQRVVFAGPQQNIEPFYGMADAFVFPSLYEPFGNVVLEAMASGLPAVVSETCGGADLIDDRRFVLDALDIPAWCEAIDAVLTGNRDGTLGRQARQRAETMTLDRMAMEMETLYCSLLGRGD